MDDKVAKLESRLASVESSFKQLQTENNNLRQIIAQLQSDLSNFKGQVDRLSTANLATESGITADQQELNTNVVIRGIDFNENTPDSELLAAYSGIATYLCISDVHELAPTNISVVPFNPGKANQSLRPLKVQFSSVAAKRQFLQIKQIKNDIFPADIGFQLTRQNQELLYQARSLRDRGSDKYKFIWSNNGQTTSQAKHQIHSDKGHHACQSTKS